MYERRPGCLTGLLQLFFLRSAYDWGQRKFGYGRGGCFGCGCGTIMMLVFIFLFFSILFGTSWGDFRFLLPGMWMM